MSTSNMYDANDFHYSSAPPLKKRHSIITGMEDMPSYLHSPAVRTNFTRVSSSSDYTDQSSLCSNYVGSSSRSMNVVQSIPDLSPQSRNPYCQPVQQGVQMSLPPFIPDASQQLSSDRYFSSTERPKQRHIMSSGSVSTQQDWTDDRNADNRNDYCRMVASVNEAVANNGCLPQPQENSGLPSFNNSSQQSSHQSQINDDVYGRRRDTYYPTDSHSSEDVALKLEEVRRMNELRKIDQIIRKAIAAKMNLLRSGSKRTREAYSAMSAMGNDANSMSGMGNDVSRSMPNPHEYMMRRNRSNSSSPATFPYEEEIDTSNHGYPHSGMANMNHHACEPLLTKENKLGTSPSMMSFPSMPSMVEKSPTQVNKQSSIAEAVKRLRRPLTAYNFFFITERKRIIQSFAEGGTGSNTVPTTASPVETFSEVIESLKTPEEKKKRKHRKGKGNIEFSELSKLVGINWRGLGEEGKQHYKQCAEMDIGRHREEKRKLELESESGELNNP